MNKKLLLLMYSLKEILLLCSLTREIFLNPSTFPALCKFFSRAFLWTWCRRAPPVLFFQPDSFLLVLKHFLLPEQLSSQICILLIEVDTPPIHLTPPESLILINQFNIAITFFI